MLTMSTLYAVLSGILVGLLYLLVRESIKTPAERSIQIITRFGKFHTAIMSVGGYRLNNPRRKAFYKTGEDYEDWDILPVDSEYRPSLSERWNLYFYPIPIFRTYRYQLSYTKLKKKGDIAPGDIVVWTDEKTGESVVARTNISDHIDFQTEYPTITGNLFTSEMAKVVVFTNNTLQATNPFKMLFRINNWLGITTETIGGALKGIVGKLSIEELNQVRSESGDTHSSDFTQAIKWINTGVEGVQDGIEELWGVQLTKSVFKSFAPGNEDAERLMNAFLEPEIARREGEATVIKATREAEAYAVNQAAIVKWKKQYLVDTGLAKVDAQGNIVELVPDANARIGAEALKELAKLQGTLVVGDDLQTMLGIQPGGKK